MAMVHMLCAPEVGRVEVSLALARGLASLEGGIIAEAAGDFGLLVRLVAFDEQEVMPARVLDGPCDLLGRGGGIPSRQRLRAGQPASRCWPEAGSR
jgi:hypothetical protein